MAREGNETGFLCCSLGEQAHELSEMLGAAQRKVVASSQAKFQALSNGKPGEAQEQDWSNPFDYMRQEQHDYHGSPGFALPPEQRSVTHSPYRSCDKRDTDDRHITTNTEDIDIYDANLRFRRVHPQETSTVSSKNNRALALQEQIIMNMEVPRDDSETSHINMTTLKKRQREIVALQEKHLSLNKELDDKAQARKILADRAKAIRQQSLLVKNTESTRQKKRVTPEDVRDPETVTGMKCQIEVELEEAAKKQAVAMLNDDQYRFNGNAGHLAFSARDIAFNHRRATTLLGPIV